MRTDPLGRLSRNGKIRTDPLGRLSRNGKIRTDPLGRLSRTGTIGTAPPADFPATGEPERTPSAPKSLYKLSHSTFITTLGSILAARQICCQSVWALSSSTRVRLTSGIHQATEA